MPEGVISWGKFRELIGVELIKGWPQSDNIQKLLKYEDEQLNIKVYFNESEPKKINLRENGLDDGELLLSFLQAAIEHDKGGISGSFPTPRIKEGVLRESRSEVKERKEKKETVEILAAEGVEKPADEEVENDIFADFDPEESLIPSSVPSPVVHGGYQLIPWDELKDKIVISEGEEGKKIKELLEKDYSSLKIGLYYKGDKEPVKFDLGDNGLSGEGALLKFLEAAERNYTSHFRDAIVPRSGILPGRVWCSEPVFEERLKTNQTKLAELVKTTQKINSIIQTEKDIKKREEAQLKGLIIKESLHETIQKMQVLISELREAGQEKLAEKLKKETNETLLTIAPPPPPDKPEREDIAEARVREVALPKDFIGGISPPPPPLTARRLNVGKSLAELANEKLVSHAEKMPEDRFKHATDTWLRKINSKLADPKTGESEKYKDVRCDRNEKDGSIKTTIMLESGKKQTIEHIYESETGCPKVKMTNPPDDHTIMLFMESSKDIEPLTLQTKCDKQDALRLFEASVISGTKIELSSDNIKELEGDERYNRLKALRDGGDKEALQQFREQVSKGDYQLGKLKVEDIPEPKKTDLVFNGPAKPS